MPRWVQRMRKLTSACVQLREAEEQGLLTRRLVSASAASGFMALGQGSSFVLLTLPGAAPELPAEGGCEPRMGYAWHLRRLTVKCWGLSCDAGAVRSLQARQVC